MASSLRATVHLRYHSPFAVRVKGKVLVILSPDFVSVIPRRAGSLLVVIPLALIFIVRCRLRQVGPLYHLWPQWTDAWDKSSSPPTQLAGCCVPGRRGIFSWVDHPPYKKHQTRPGLCTDLELYEINMFLGNEKFTNSKSCRLCAFNPKVLVLTCLSSMLVQSSTIVFLGIINLILSDTCFLFQLALYHSQRSWVLKLTYYK